MSGALNSHVSLDARKRTLVAKKSNMQWDMGLYKNRFGRVPSVEVVSVLITRGWKLCGALWPGWLTMDGS
jgi:hypothetical protein